MDAKSHNKIDDIELGDVVPSSVHALLRSRPVSESSDQAA